ncbi:MAG: hypothetical protein R3266_09960, partial [Gemmatimonadota bacterium]|nr:hypothetical protein [Gemmatimonadota bacterium]
MTRGDAGGVRFAGWIFAAATAAFALLFYRDFAFRPATVIAGRDLLVEGWPLRAHYVEALRAGHGVPLWTPHIYGGIPFVGLLPGPIFYPTTLLYFFLPLGRAIGWTFVLHTFLGGVFAYFMARSFRLRPWSACVCGASFFLTGYVTSHLFGGQDGRMFAMTLMPLAFGCLERALRSGEVRWYAGLGITVALQIFTPHAQIVYFSSLALGLYLLYHLAVRVGPDKGEPEAGRNRFVRPIAGFGLAFVLAACAGAAQLLPTFALLDDVTRSAAETGYAFAASWALPPQELTALFLPDLVGSLGTYWGTNPLKLHTEYLGSIPIALALLAVAGSFRPVLAAGQRRTVWFLAGASAVGLLFALGAATPVHRIATAVLPLMSSFRAPVMMMSAVALFVALLAGFGWETVLAARAREGHRGGPASPIVLLL